MDEVSSSGQGTGMMAFGVICIIFVVGICGYAIKYSMNKKEEDEN